MKNIKTVIFDYDGTIHNGAGNYIDAFRHVYHQMVADGAAPERSFEDSEITQWLGYSAQEMWQNFMPELPEEVQMCYSKRIGQFMFDRVKQKKAVLYEGAAETLNYLKEKGYQLIYLSNCGAEYMKIHTECFGLKNYFSQMYCSGDYDFQPKYEIFNVIREACPGEYLVVGDRFHDMEIARYHKVYTAGCLYGFGSREELKDADVLLDDIRDLQKIL